LKTALFGIFKENVAVIYLSPHAGGLRANGSELVALQVVQYRGEDAVLLGVHSIAFICNS
jgi:hypothetical protein